VSIVESVVTGGGSIASVISRALRSVASAAGI
jgi:hypothetical protein